METRYKGRGKGSGLVIPSQHQMWKLEECYFWHSLYPRLEAPSNLRYAGLVVLFGHNAWEWSIIKRILTLGTQGCGTSENCAGMCTRHPAVYVTQEGVTRKQGSFWYKRLPFSSLFHLTAVTGSWGLSKEALRTHRVC